MGVCNNDDEAGVLRDKKTGDQDGPVTSCFKGDLTIGALERLFNALPRCKRACVVVTV